MLNLRFPILQTQVKNTSKDTELKSNSNEPAVPGSYPSFEALKTESLINHHKVIIHKKVLLKT